MKIENINSAGIRAEAKKMGITTANLLASAGEGDQKITVYQVGDVRVAATNGDPVWEQQDLVDFAELLTHAGIDL